MQILWKLPWMFVKKLKKKEGPYDPAIPFLGIHPTEAKSVYHRDIYTF